MRYRIPALIVLLTAIGAYFAASYDASDADVRIVQAPPTASPPTTSTPTAGATAGAVRHSGSFAVGFTLFEGRLYLVSTSDEKAAARPAELTAPTFVCDQKPSTAPDTDQKFEAWLLRNNGGSGTVPRFDDDGNLLTAPHTGTPLHCALREGPEQ